MTGSGSTTEPPVAHCEVTDGCITCGDVAVALTVVAVMGADANCRDAQGRTETVATELVGDVAVGDELLVHAGVALERLTTTRG
jgi:hydrogenase maturation factor